MFELTCAGLGRLGAVSGRRLDCNAPLDLFRFDAGTDVWWGRRCQLKIQPRRHVEAQSP
jgi:hypothetical protein